MTTAKFEPGIQVDKKKIQDGGHRNDADGSVVFSVEFSSAKKIRGVRRSLYTVVEEKSLRSGIPIVGNYAYFNFLFVLQFFT